MSSLTNLTRTQALSLVLAVVVVLPATVGVATAATTTDLTVSIDDDDNTLAPGETTTVAVAVTDVDGGAGATELGVSLDDASVAEITDISVLNNPGFSDNSISGDGSSADFNYAGADSADTGEVTIIEVTVEAVAGGSTSIEIGPNSQTGNLILFDEEGAGYTLDSVGSATLVVEDANAPPTASFTANPSAPEAGEQVSFDASASNDSDGSIASYEWEFGDGATATGASAGHTYDTAGDYDVELTVTDDDGATDTATQTVSVSEAPDPPNQPPTADAGDDQTVAEGDSVKLDATGSSDADGDDLSYAWTQTGGTDVTLSDDGTATPSFAAPDVDANETLAFEVEVSDGNATATDAVSVAVEDADDADPPGDEEPPADGPSTEVGLSPESDLVAVGDSAEYDVVVDDADGGVGVYSMTVAVDDPSVASITDADLSGVSENLTDVQIAEDGSSATIEAVLVDTNDTGSVTLGTVTVESAAEGTTTVSLDVAELGDESGNAYEVTATSGATLEASTLVVGDSDAPAQDPDGDGVYEDVNGDGSVDVLDVQTLFADRDGSVVQNSPDAFDFNGDGEFSLLDIQTLFAEETG